MVNCRGRCCQQRKLGFGLPNLWVSSDASSVGHVGDAASVGLKKFQTDDGLTVTKTAGHPPTYLAYRPRAVLMSSVPWMMARPSRKIVISYDGSDSVRRTKKGLRVMGPDCSSFLARSSSDRLVG